MIRRSHTPRRAFTLVELLIVLAIIGLLAAILFPVFRSAKERGYQTHCASNLMQIYQAVQLYRQDEKYYPSSLAVLLPSEFTLGNYGGAVTNIPMAPPAPTAGPACDTAGQTCPNPDGTGYFKAGRDGLACDDDDTDTSIVRSSYGDISANPGGGPTDDMGRYVWNYWGYRPSGGTCTSSDVRGCDGTAFLTSSEASSVSTSLLLNTSGTYDSRKNPIKYSLSNRYAPTSTIITHCVYHRLPTASGKLSDPFEVYSNPTNGAGARDIVLRLDGTAKLLDISAFAGNSNWQKQNF